MLRAIKNDWALFAGILMLVAAASLLTTLLTVRGAAIGFSSSQIGAIQAACPFGALFGSIYAPRLIARVGHIRSFGALASLCSTVAVIHLMTNDPWVWGGMRFLAGLCFPGLFVIAESWLNAKAGNQSRGGLLAIYFVTQTVGNAIGPYLAGLHDANGVKLFGLTSILISLCLVPLLISRNPAPEIVDAERMPMRRFLRISPMALSGVLLSGGIVATLQVALPLYGLGLGLNAAAASHLLVVAAVTGALAQFPVAWISDRVDRRIVIATVAAIGGGASLLALAGHPGGRGIVVATAAIAAAFTPLYSLCIAHANDHLAPGQVVSASGTLVFTYNLGVVFGSFVGPAIIGGLGPSGFMILLAALGLSIAAIALVRRSRRAAPADTGQAHPVPGTAQTAEVMAPVEMAEEATSPAA